MDTPVLASTAFITVLLMIGLFFFIRASTKERIEVARLAAQMSQDELLQGLREYFGQRSYQVISVDPDNEQVTFEGFVRPSLFLAIFLSTLAAIGLVCFSLILSFLFPQSNFLPYLLLLFAPLAGRFYWQRSERYEQVTVCLEEPTSGSLSQVTVTGHRDELAELQRSLNLNLLEST